MTQAKKKLEAILVKERGGAHYAMFFCRGDGKCTRSLIERKKLSRKNRACPDCVRGEESETLEQVMQRMDRGDA